MSRTVALRFLAFPGTRAGIGRAGARTVIADRPEGVAGGEGLGFNGAELLAAAQGGCFWNDLHHAAEARGIILGQADVRAEVTIAGAPPRVVRAHIHAQVMADSGAHAREVFDAARAGSTIANSVAAAFPVAFAFEDSPQ